MEIPTDDRNLYTAESVEMVDQREIIGTWSVYTPDQIEPEPEPEPEPEVTYVAEVNGTKYETLEGCRG